MSPEKTPRPNAAQGTTYKLEDVACYDAFVVLNGWEGEDNREMFLKCGPQGSCTAAIMNALSVLFSIARRCGIPLGAIANLLHRHGGSCSRAIESGKKTCIFAIGELLSELATDEEDDSVGTPISMEGRFRIRFTGCGPMRVSCGNDSEFNLRYLDVRLARANTCANTISSAVSDLITLMLGYGVEPDKIVSALAGISCPSARQDNSSCLDGIARAIADHISPPAIEEAA